MDGRSVAVADLDGDGGLDLVIANNGAPPTLYRNRLGTGRHWVRFRLVSRDSNPGAVGARLVLSAAGVTQTRWVEVGSGYASQSPYAVHFGLGEAEALDGLEIDWPSGLRESYDRQRLTALGALDRQVELVEGAANSG
ncbi:MAG: ASPIC/UnbV domain-containing protein [Deltaproteobacteria bacterium]|nr:ASPIC/UnbV domain-containing protein [Deltaproteobacteria bacterium]